LILQALQEDSHKLPADEQEAGHATPVKNQFQVNLTFGLNAQPVNLEPCVDFT